MDWLIKWHASRAKRRWEEASLRQDRDELRRGSLSDGSLFALGLAAAAAGLISGVVGGMEAGPGTEALLLVVTVAGAALIYGTSAGSHYVQRDLYEAETAVAAAEHAEEQQGFREWQDKLKGRPTDEEIVEKEPIDIVVENFDRGFLDRLRENKAALRELALDNSGVAGAVRLLNTIAREGRDWLRLQRERHNLKIDDLYAARYVRLGPDIPARLRRLNTAPLRRRAGRRDG